MKNLPRLVAAVVSTLIWEGMLVAAWLWLLPLLEVRLPLPYLFLAMAVLAAYAVFNYCIGSRALNKKAMAGMSDMAGMRGKAVSRLKPTGTVRIDSELWEARSLEPRIIEPGEEIEVLKQEGLKLIVRRKGADNPGSTH